MTEAPPSDQTLDFERLVGDLSARFAGLAAEEIDDVLLESIAALGEFFSADRIQLSEITRDSTVRVTHSWSRQGIEAVPVGTMWAAMIPGALEMIRAGEIFSFSNIDELTEERYSVDRQTFLEVGTQAHLSIPVEVGGEILGVLTFGVISEPRHWPEAQVERLRLIAQVFGNALARRDSERELQSTLTEVRSLKQRLLAESRYLEKEIAETGRFEEIIGESAAIRAIFHQVEQAEGLGVGEQVEAQLRGAA